MEFSQLRALFAKKKLSADDLVVLSGTCSLYYSSSSTTLSVKMNATILFHRLNVRRSILNQNLSDEVDSTPMISSKPNSINESEIDKIRNCFQFVTYDIQA